MTIVLIKNGKRVAAFYNPKGSGHVEIDYDSPLAAIYKTKYSI
jgi:hypothetical protein